MSPTSVLRRAVQPPGIGGVERRVHARFPIVMDLECKLVERNGVKHLGVGRTLNIGRGGVLFEAGDAFELTAALPGSAIELQLQWPLLLDGVWALKLVLRGRIVRRDNRRLALKMGQYEFRTAGNASQTEAGVSKG